MYSKNFLAPAVSPTEPVVLRLRLAPPRKELFEVQIVPRDQRLAVGDVDVAVVVAAREVVELEHLVQYQDIRVRNFQVDQLLPHLRRRPQRRRVQHPVSPDLEYRLLFERRRRGRLALA